MWALNKKIDTSKFTSRDEIAKLIKPESIGVELGVAEGKYSEKLLRKSELKFLYSIDAYDGKRGHDIQQYKKALKLLEPYKERNSLLKMRFNEALDLFPDEYFDFIYIDGYAHTGQEEGKTLQNWYPKLKKGGIFSGDDYSEKWPKNVENIDNFAREKNLKLNIINDWNGHHSWVTIKK